MSVLFRELYDTRSSLIARLKNSLNQSVGCHFYYSHTWHSHRYVKVLFQNQFYEAGQMVGLHPFVNNVIRPIVNLLAGHQGSVSKTILSIFS